MWNVWRTVLEENEKMARARLAAVEVFQQQVADDAKVLRSQKLHVVRKVKIRPFNCESDKPGSFITECLPQCLDQLAMAQKELQLTVQDVDKHKKLYFDEEHSAHDVRDKAKDIEEK